MRAPDAKIHAGGVVIDPGFTFQRLQSLVGDLIGVPPHQIKLYLLRQKKTRSGRSPPEIRRKTPIGEGTDFAAMAREKGCVVLAQLKGAKKDRRGKGRRDRVGVGMGVGVGGEGNFAPEKKRVLLPEKAILRRPVDVHVGAPAVSIAPLARENGTGLIDMFHYENLRDLQRQRERYLLATAAAYCGYAGGGAPHGYGAVGFGDRCALADAAVVAGLAAAVCEVCSGSGGGRAAPFHWCVHDRVVAEGFRSRAGPIQRPLKSRVHAAV
ncbi:hypothetical protein Taro_010069 [Colocasia esculenta]|uniref:DUF7138 domain-containing protein n=1 Tax=Colocasia esculenta TaxID=4460 RepID=A0A843U2B9_COLES|nr:hypothetical protein [Colocasia esculenta]